MGWAAIFTRPTRCSRLQQQTSDTTPLGIYQIISICLASR